MPQKIEYQLISLGQWANRVGVCRQRAHQWYQQGRIKARPCVMPDGRVKLLLPADTPRPEPRKRGRK